MQHPKSENILKVIQNFEKVIKKFPSGILQMDIGAVNIEGYECGTAHCHGGWYAVARELKEIPYTDFMDGAFQMAVDLGFMDGTELEEWASLNICIWGNVDGMSMFCTWGAKSFQHPTRRPKGAENLQHIVDHWREVYERVRALEEKESPKTSQPSRENITKKLAVDSVEERI